MAIITIPRPLREKLGEDGTDALVEVLSQVTRDIQARTLTFVDERFEHRLSLTDERFEHRLSEEVSKLNQRITEEVGKINQRLTEEVGKINQRLTEEVSRLDQKISMVQADLIKWMFIFWIGQIAVMSGIFFALLRFAVT